MRFLVIYLFIAGIGGVATGVTLTVTEWGASVTPVPASIEDLEAGEEVPNQHMRLGEHVALYDSAVVAIRVKKGQTAPVRGDRLAWIIYPVVATQNPLASDTQQDPVDGRVRVMVKSSRYFSQAEIPQGNRKETSLSGMVVSNFTQLGIEEQKLLKQHLPGLDFSQLIVIKDRLKPQSLALKLGLIVGGLIVLAIAIFAKRQSGKAPVESEQA